MDSNERNIPGSASCTQKSENMTVVREEGNASFFRSLILPTLLYALIVVFCRYKNSASILCPFWMAGTIAYIHTALRRLDRKTQRITYFYESIMLLLSISDMMTANSMIYIFNNLICDVLLVIVLIRDFYPEMHWQIHQWIAAIFRSVLGAIEALADWGQDCSETVKSRGTRNAKTLSIIVGICIAVPLFIGAAFLLASADTVFRQIIKQFIPRSFDGTDIIGILLLFAFAFFGAYCGIRFLDKGRRLAGEQTRKSSSLLPAYIILTPLTVLYLFFSFLQISCLFFRRLTLPAGTTYAEYAHQGFYQLLAVVILNLIVVLAMTGIFERRRALQILLTVFTACTYIMIASAFLRIQMYIGAYHLTELRLLVVWLLLTLAVLFLVVLVYIYREDAPLARWLLVIACIAWLIPSFGKVDRVIASYNIAHMTQQELADDRYYIASLSEDAAVPVLRSGNQGLIQMYEENHVDTRDKMKSFRNYNFALAEYLHMERKS